MKLNAILLFVSTSKLYIRYVRLGHQPIFYRISKLKLSLCTYVKAEIWEISFIQLANLEAYQNYKLNKKGISYLNVHKTMYGKKEL